MAAIEWAKLGVEVGGWIVGIIARYVAGDDGPEVRRVIDVLPAQMRADVEHERQRALLAAELAAQLRGTEPPPSPFDGAALTHDPAIVAVLRQHGYDDSSPVATLTTIIEELERLGGLGARSPGPFDGDDGA